jgi:hypothetical protein
MSFKLWNTIFNINIFTIHQEWINYIKIKKCIIILLGIIFLRYLLVFCYDVKPLKVTWLSPFCLLWMWYNKATLSKK